jgi:hypothetical protein
MAVFLDVTRFGRVGTSIITGSPLAMKGRPSGAVPQL